MAASVSGNHSGVPMRLWKKFLIGVPIAFLLVSVVVYFGALHSQAYLVACNFVRTDPVIQRRLGKVEKIQLKPLTGWRISYSGPNGVANFGLDVAGHKADGEVYVNMKTQLGEWEITGAKLKLEGGSFINVK